jgi:hypothetical protein
MDKRILFAGIIVLAVFILTAGCTQSGTSSANTGSTAVPSTLSTPGPTQTLPIYWSVAVQVGSNGKAIDPQIIMTFNGGNGMNLVQEIDMQVTRTDGVVETGKLTQPLASGQTITLQGTTGNYDRAEVWVVTPQGDRVKIIDQYVPFRQYH